MSPYAPGFVIELAADGSFALYRTHIGAGHGELVATHNTLSGVARKMTQAIEAETFDHFKDVFPT